MSRRLTEEQKRRNKLFREEKKREKDMSLNIDERCYEILRILRDASNHPEIKYNSKYFEHHFNTSNVTILRAIRTLKDMGLICEKQVNGSYVINGSFDDNFYSEKVKKNIALVASLRGLLQQYKNTPLYESVGKLIYFLQPEVAKNDSVFSSGRIVVAPQIDYEINVKNWNIVYEAIQKNRLIEFRYTKSYKNTEAKRFVYPFQLILDNGTVYFFGYSKYSNLPLLYDLNYMTEIKITVEEFTLPEKYDINDYCNGGRLGTFVGNESEDYKIQFYDYAKEWIKNHKCAENQTFEEKDDSTIVSFSSSQFEKILELVLGWGRQAKPLTPTRLVDRWKEEILEMYNLINTEV